MAARVWITREGRAGTGLRYRLPSGTLVRSQQELDRIEALRIPPAWRRVHIAANPRAAIQAWGIDARGRKQYRYHPRAVERGQQRKYYRVRSLARSLPTIRHQLWQDCRSPEPTRERVAAVVVRLLSEGFFRVGSERYARENHTVGIATMRKKDVRVDGEAIIFHYVGKGSIAHRQVVVDPAVRCLVEEMLQTPGARLFRYRTEQGWSNLRARDVNAYIRGLTGARYSAKDFRTWGGTLRVATVLSDLGRPASAREAKRNVVLAVRLAAAELGNTPAICRKSYVHPIVIARYLDAGVTITPRPVRRPRAGRPPSIHESEERALIRFLDRYFPERRRRSRARDRAA
ncbi:MAG TPA: hypothetical protein VFW98_03695 [Gemmatimonadaceae bacterium]|nr:hypothetical protein [Gemmatimonadaceae bacterium]